MRRIFEIKNWFISFRVKNDGSFKGSSYRILKRDMLNIAQRLETTINADLKKWHFDAQRRRVNLMLESIETIDNSMHDLLFAGSEHN